MAFLAGFIESGGWSGDESEQPLTYHGQPPKVTSYQYIRYSLKLLNKKTARMVYLRLAELQSYMEWKFRLTDFSPFPECHQLFKVSVKYLRVIIELPDWKRKKFSAFFQYLQSLVIKDFRQDCENVNFPPASIAYIQLVLKSLLPLSRSAKLTEFACFIRAEFFEI